MAEVIRMPLLSDTMKEGIIAEWHKNVGDKIKSDDILADVETDKATMEVMPYVDGTLLYVGVEKGKAAKVNDIIAIVGKEGEDFQALLKEESNKTTEPAEDNKKEKEKAPADSDKGKVDNPKEDKASEPKAEDQLPKEATVVRMPLLSDTMKEGKIVTWHKSVGDKVVSDDVLADVETDKATMEVMGYADGVLLHQGVKAGEAAKINEVIAIVGKEGTDISAFLEAEKTTQPQAANKTEEDKPAEKQEQSTPKSTSEKEKAEPQNPSDEGRLKASPLAKKLAKEKGYDLSQINGSGDNGRIIKRDIEEYQPQSATRGDSKEKVAAVASFSPGEEGATDVPVSQMRGIIAKRLSESKFGAPHFYLRISVKMDNAIEARKHINDVSPVKVSFNDMIIKACAMALRQHPEVNSSWLGDTLRTYQHIHVGTAVAVEEGLLVPVIRFADQKSLSQIAADTNTLIEKAKNKKLQPQEFSGNTFTISNLGMMDIDEFTAIINPPDAAILAVGKIDGAAVVENNEMVIRQIMKLTLSCDHRVVDGAVGARFLQTLKTYLENPVTMLV